MTSETLSLDPVWPLLQVVALALGAAVLAGWLYRAGPAIPGRHRLWVLMAMRLAVVVGVAALLLNPIRTRAERETGRPPLFVLLDTSHSMATRDIDGRSRFQAIKERLLGGGGLLRKYGKQFEPVLFGVADTATRQDPAAFARVAKPDGARTHLGESLAAAGSSIGGATSGGVLLVSDGRNNGEIDPVEIARQMKTRRFPVFTLCLGNLDRATDASIRARRPQVYGAPDQEIEIGGEVRAAGLNGRPAEVSLLRNGRPIARKSVKLADDRDVPVTFPIKEAHTGSYRYAFALETVPGELTASNNRSSVFVRVLNSKTRVLVLEGRPTWDAKFLIQALHSDPSIELDAVFKLTADKFFALQGTTPEPAATRPTAAEAAARQEKPKVKIPTTAKELARYNVIFIGKGYEEFFTDDGARALKQYVSDHSGNLVFLRGEVSERAQPLRALEPVDWSADQIKDFRMKVTEEGQAHPAFNFRTGGAPQPVIQKLPSLISATRIEGEKSLAVVLARAEGVRLAGSDTSREMAVLAYQNYGQGKVVALVGHGLWRWAFLPPDLKQFTGCYNDFWTQLTRWLVSQSDFLPGQEVTLKPDRTSYSPGDTARLLAFVRGSHARALPSLELLKPDGKTERVSLTKGSGTEADYSAAFKPRVPGEYVASLKLSDSPAGSIMAPFNVYHAREEDLVTAADPALMSRIAQSGGGEVLSLESLPSFPQKLRDARSLLTIRTQPRPAWDRWWVLAILLSLLTTEWVLRRRWGLI